MNKSTHILVCPPRYQFMDGCGIPISQACLDELDFLGDVGLLKPTEAAAAAKANDGRGGRRTVIIYQN